MNWGQFSSSATSTLILVGFFSQPERFCPGPSNLHGHLQEPKGLQQGKQKLKYPQRKCFFASGTSTVRKPMSKFLP